MKSKFAEYYETPNLPELWKSATFTFDANVLLDLYSLSPKSSDELLTVLERLGEREQIWIPYQFAYEYHKNLKRVRSGVDNDYKAKRRDLEKILADTEKKLKSFETQSRFKINESRIKKVKTAIEDVIPDLDKFAVEHKQRLEQDGLEEQIAKLFAGRVGKPNMDPRINDISIVGKSRYERGIPPGFKDANKSKSDPYGDLIGWFQIIAHAKHNECPVILITNDSSSDDWFEKQGSELLGPRKELVKEMRSEAGVDFYIYRTARFLEYAKKHVSNGISDATIEEVKRLQRSSDWHHLSIRQARDLVYAATNRLESSDLSPKEKNRQLEEIMNSEIGRAIFSTSSYFKRPRPVSDADWRSLRHDEIALDYAFEHDDDQENITFDWEDEEIHEP